MSQLEIHTVTSVNPVPPGSDCDPAGDLVEDIPGLFFAVENLSADAERSIEVRRHIAGALTEAIRAPLVPGSSIIGPLDFPYRAVLPFPTGPVQLSYPDGAEGLRIAAMLPAPIS